MRLLLVIFASLISANAWGQTLEEIRLKNKSKVNYLNDLTLDTNAQKLDRVDNSSGATYTFGLKYKLNTKSNLWAFARLSKRFSGEERFDLLDTILRYERTLGKLYDFSHRARLSAILPTNENVHETTSFVGGLSGQIRSGKALSDSFYLQFINTLRWNFHEYRVSELASPNIQATLSSLAYLSYSPLTKLNLSLGLGWRFAKSYKNNITDRYSIDFSGSYNLPKKLSLTAGVTTDGSPLSADGQSSNIRIFNERNTVYYLSLSHFY